MRRENELAISLENFNEKNPFLIVGVDPGTTTGIAVITLEGELISTKSRRNFSRAEIVKFIYSLGEPIVVATDINPAPTGVEKLATSLPAKLFYPESTLKRREKTKLAKTFEVDSRHERDALAAAIYAYKRLKPMMNKVRQKMKSKPEEEIEREIVSRIFKVKRIIKHEKKL